MNLLIATILEICSLIKKNSKIIFFAFICFLWIILIGKDMVGDRANYYSRYLSYGKNIYGYELEMGYQFLMMLAIKCNLSFKMFIALYSIIPFLLISHTILAYSNNPAFVVSLYFFYPFLLDAEQLRSFMGAAIIIFAIPFLIDGKKVGIAKYLFFCILASLFHSSCLAFIILALIYVPQKILSRIIPFIFLLFFFVRKNVYHFIRMLNIANETDKIGYFKSLNSEKAVFSVLYFFIAFLITILILKKFKMPNETESKKQFNYLMLKINLISMLYLPLVAINDNFTRIPRIILVLDYIVLSNYIGKKITKYREVFIVLGALLIAGIRFASYFSGGGYETLIIPFFLDGFQLFNI